MTPQTDPRTAITPDAFEVSPELLGLPLATPARRGLATLIDLVLIGVITLVTKDIGAIVGVLVAIVFVRMALKSPITRDLPAPLAWAFQFSVGCLGLVILLVSFATIWLLRSGGDLGLPLSVESDALGESVDLGDLMSGLQGGVRLTRATSAAEAEEAATEIARGALAAGMSESDVEDLLDGLAPDDPVWDDEADADDIFERAIATAAAEVAPAEGSGEEGGPVADTMTAEAALLAYVRLLEAGDTTAADFESIRRRAGVALAADTIRALQAGLDRASQDSERSQQALAAVQAQVDELEEGSGLVRLARDVIDRLGLAFGWGSIYFAVLLPWWKGQTPGKKLLGVRVLRLTGEPITWWFAFERAGGYAAGFATGLLGFAQVYWDPNRQGIHDKIAGTVVIREGAPRVPSDAAGLGSGST
jgi:hypothetical protein